MRTNYNFKFNQDSAGRNNNNNNKKIGDILLMTGKSIMGNKFYITDRNFSTRMNSKNDFSEKSGVEMKPKADKEFINSGMNTINTDKNKYDYSPNLSFRFNKNIISNDNEMKQVNKLMNAYNVKNNNVKELGQKNLSCSKYNDKITLLFLGKKLGNNE